MARATWAVLAISGISMNIAGQTPASGPKPEIAAFSRPSFVLHDPKLSPEKPHTVLNPDGSFYISGGTSMIQVSSLAFSADGKLLAVGSTPGIVDIWDVETGHKIRALKGARPLRYRLMGTGWSKTGGGSKSSICLQATS